MIDDTQRTDRDRATEELASWQHTLKAGAVEAQEDLTLALGNMSADIMDHEAQDAIQRTAAALTFVSKLRSDLELTAGWALDVVSKEVAR